MTIDKYTIDIQVGGINNLTALSSAMLNLNAAVKGNIKVAKDFDATQAALDAALGRTDKGVQNHAKNLGQLLNNQATLGNEYRRVNRDIKEYKTGLASATVQQRANLPVLEQYSKSLGKIKARAFADDLRSITVEMKRLGKDAQFTGRSMIIGLTTPILAFGRTGLNSFKQIDAELIRLNKLMENIGSTTENALQKIGATEGKVTDAMRKQAERMVAEYRRLDQSLLDISLRFGDARELIIGIAGDFAEFGFIVQDNIVALTELAASAEKLGSMDIGPSKDLLTSMYAQANLLIQEQAAARGKVVDAVEAETRAVNIARGQLALFNSVENATALSLRDIASAFPEVAASATSFGLTMTESIALLAPMKAAGYDIGAASNSIKVSLQRLNDPTIKSTQLIADLSRITGYDFTQSTRIGLTAIDALVQGYDHLERSTNYGREGALEFFDEVFGVRQGPRMQRAIADLNVFNNAMTKTGTQEFKIISLANKELRVGQSALKSIRSFSDIGAVVRVANAEIGDQVKYLDEFGKEAVFTVTQRDIDAAKKARQAVGKYIEDGIKQNKDILSNVTSQAGRALVIELAGAEEAQKRADSELKTALDGVNVFIEKIRTSFKVFAADFIEAFKPTIVSISETVQSLVEKFRNLEPGTKKFIAILAGIAAAAGPLVFAFGQARLLLSTFANITLKLLPGLANITLESLTAGDALLRLRKPVILMGNSFESSASRMSLFIARLANMNGPIGAFARRIGVMTGALRKTVTASDDVIARMAALSHPAPVSRLGGAAQLRSLGNFPPNSLPPPNMPPGLPNPTAAAAAAATTTTTAATTAATTTTTAATTAATATTGAATTAATSTTGAAATAAASTTGAATAAAATTTSAATAASATAGAATAGVITASNAAIASINTTTAASAAAIAARSEIAAARVALHQVESERFIEGATARRIAREEAAAAAIAAQEEAVTASQEAALGRMTFGFQAALQEANAALGATAAELTATTAAAAEQAVVAATTATEYSVAGFTAVLEESAASFMLALEAQDVIVTGMAASIEGAAALLSSAGIELNTAAISLAASSGMIPGTLAQNLGAKAAMPALASGAPFGALPAAGQTSNASKWLPIRGEGGRMKARFTSVLSRPEGGVIPMPPEQLALPAAGQTVKARGFPPVPQKLKYPNAIFASEFEANKLTSPITQAIPMGPVPKAIPMSGPRPVGPFAMPPVPTPPPDYSNLPRKAKKAAQAADAKRAADAARAAKAATAEVATTASVATQTPIVTAKAAEQSAAAAARRELKAANRVVAETVKREAIAAESMAAAAVPSVKPSRFNPKKGSFVSQLFNAGKGDIPGAPMGGASTFAQEAMAMEKAKASTRPRRFFRSVLRKGPVSNIMPMSARTAIENALPFEDEISPRFMQTKYTGNRLGDRFRLARGVAKGKAITAGQAVKEGALTAGRAVKSGVTTAGGAIVSGVSTGARAAAELGAGAISGGAKVASESFDSLGKTAKKAMSATGEAVHTGAAKTSAGFRLFGKSAKEARDKLGYFNDKQIDKLKASKAVTRIKTFGTNFADGRIVGAGKSGVEVVKKVSGFNTISGGIGGAKSAVSGLEGTPGIFAKMTAGIKGFASGMKGTMGIMKVFKLAFMGLGITAIIIGIVAAVKILIDIFKSGGKSMESVGKNFSKAWEYIKTAVMAVIKPIKDAIFTLVSMAGDGGGVKGGFQKISEFIKNMAKSISDFVKKYIVPIVTFVMTQVVNLIKGIVKIIQGVISLFKGDTKNALDKLKSGVATVGRVILKIVLGIVKGWISLWAWMVKSIIKLVGKIISYIIKGIGGAIQWVGEKFADFVEGIPFIGDDLADGIRDSVNLISDSLDSMGNGVEGVANGIASGVDTVANAAKDGIESVGNVLIDKMNEWAGAEQKLLSSSNTKKKKDRDPRDQKVEEIAYDPLGSPIENAANKIADAIKQAMESLQQKFVDLVLGKLNDALQKATDQMIDALEKQKDAALKVYDDQAENLDKIQKAEESLTREMQYQADRRRIIKERELQVENYQRDRALAIYEGRIDDARMLALQDVKNNLDYQENLKSIDNQRNRDLAQENLEALRKSISDAKEEASKFFDEQINNFRNAAQEITKFPPLTIEEYKSQLDKLNNAATEAAKTNGDTFSEMLDTMVTNINDTIPNKGVPAFENSLNQLVQVAHDKYGLEENGIAGLTVAMLENIGAAIDGNTFINESFTSIVDDLKNSADEGFKAISDSITIPALDALSEAVKEHDPFKVLAEAVAFANETILREMQAMVTGTASKVGWLIPYLDQYIVKLATAAAIAGALEGGGAPTDPSGPLRVHDAIQWYNKNRGTPGISFFNNAKQYGGSIPTKAYSNGGLTPAKAYANGGHVRSFAVGGSNKPMKGMVTGGFDSTGVPAMLHGGEFIVNAKAVKNIGLATLTLMNNLRFNRGKDITNVNSKFDNPIKGPTIESVPVEIVGISSDLFKPVQNFNPPKFDDFKFKRPSIIDDINFRNPENRNPQSGIINNSTTSSTVNIYVDNFIGEDEWFNGMIKQYNMNVLPKKEKGAGLENRVISTYNGLSRGM